MTGTAITNDTSTRFAESQRLQPVAHHLIPGGAHTYAKGDDQFPVLSPGFIRSGSGCRVTDIDGNSFIEYGSGCRSVVLGHAHPQVNAAVIQAIGAGTNFSRPAELEVRCASDILDLFPVHDMVKFAKNGSDVTTAAIRLARAATGREMVAVCVDHPFFSTDDWFIGTTAMPAGIPQMTRNAVVGFNYNDPGSLDAVFSAYPNQIAAVIMEPEGQEAPEPGYLAGVRARCTAAGTVFVLDEIICGFRYDRAGGQSIHRVTPDLCTFGKSLGNGFAVSALMGRRDLMELGGLDHDHERVFLLSTTHGAESAGLAAARALMDVQANERVIETLYRQGAKLARGFMEISRSHGIADFLHVAGRDCNLVYVTKDASGERSQDLRTVFMQELIRGGVLGPSFVVNAAHDDAAIAQTLDAVSAAADVYARALEDGVGPYLVGRSVKPVFRPRA